jgi:hypothetical protein
MGSLLSNIAAKSLSYSTGYLCNMCHDTWTTEHLYQEAIMSDSKTYHGIESSFVAFLQRQGAIMEWLGGKPRIEP